MCFVIFTVNALLTLRFFEMGTAGRELFEREQRGDNERCRICASDVHENERVDIFADDTRKKYLQTKIRKYLYILVSNTYFIYNNNYYY